MNDWNAAVAEARRLGARREKRLNIAVALLLIVFASVGLWGAILYPLHWWL